MAHSKRSRLPTTGSPAKGKRLLFDAKQAETGTKVFVLCSAKALISAITRFEAPPSFLKEIEEAESKIQAEVCFGFLSLCLFLFTLPLESCVLCCVLNTLR